MKHHIFDPTVLRAYDIRGIYQQTLQDDDAFAIGLTFAVMQQDHGFGPRVAVGRDGTVANDRANAQQVREDDDGHATFMGMRELRKRFVEGRVRYGSNPQQTSQLRGFVESTSSCGGIDCV